MFRPRSRKRCQFPEQVDLAISGHHRQCQPGWIRRGPFDPGADEGPTLNRDPVHDRVDRRLLVQAWFEVLEHVSHSALHGRDQLVHDLDDHAAVWGIGGGSADEQFILPALPVVGEVDQPMVRRHGGCHAVALLVGRRA